MTFGQSGQDNQKKILKELWSGGSASSIKDWMLRMLARFTASFFFFSLSSSSVSYKCEDEEEKKKKHSLARLNLFVNWPFAREWAQRINFPSILLLIVWAGKGASRIRWATFLLFFFVLSGPHVVCRVAVALGWVRTNDKEKEKRSQFLYFLFPWSGPTIIIWWGESRYWAWSKEMKINKELSWSRLHRSNALDISYKREKGKGT